jgi:hypothetical protein
MERNYDMQKVLNFTFLILRIYILEDQWKNGVIEGKMEP